MAVTSVALLVIQFCEFKLHMKTGSTLPTLIAVTRVVIALCRN